MSVSKRILRFWKPYAVLTQFTDDKGRATLADYIPVPHVYAAGRLDYDSEGLLLLTDNNWLKHRLTDPRYGHPRTYWVQVEGIPDDRALNQLQAGVVIQGKQTRPAQVLLLDNPPNLPERAVPIRYRKNIPTAWLALTISEGRNRQVRRMTAAVGHPTLRLVRCAIGPITLDGLHPAEWRWLTETEQAQLIHSLGR